MTTLWEAMKITALKACETFKVITLKRIKSLFLCFACLIWIVMPFIVLFVWIPVVRGATDIIITFVVILSWCLYWIHVFIEWRW